MRTPALALTLWLLSAPLSAIADDEPTPGEMAEARVHFEQAREFEEEGEYENAADEYLSAYALYPDPEFFFNAGRVLRHAGDLDRALRYYERYLELDPDGRGAGAAEEQVEALRKELAAAQDDEPRPEDDEPPEAKDPDAAPAAGDVTDPGPLDPADPDAELYEADAGQPSRGMRIAGIATGTAGVVALGASAYFGNRARTLDNNISAFVADDPDAWTDDMISKYEQGRRANTSMLVLGGVGIVAVGAGATLYLLSDSGGSNSGGVAVTPSMRRDGAGLSLEGSF